MNSIKSIDDLPMEAIGALKMLREVFKDSSFENSLNEEFLNSYNLALDMVNNQKGINNE